MQWANFLHIYQPAEQQSDILEAIVTQSYRPLLQGLKRHKRVRLTLNVNGALLELFDRDRHHDLIDILRQLGREGRIEFTSSAKYHAFLPYLEQGEIVRQVVANNEANTFYLGDAYRPKGFFPPEMAYSEKLAPIVEELGFDWLILDEIACGGDGARAVDYTKGYRIAGTKVRVFFRERRLSNLIMSAVVRSGESLREAMPEDSGASRYVLTAMDGETFGHHRPGLVEMLFDILKAPEFEFITISDIPRYYPEEREVVPVTSTWASSHEDIRKGIQFLSWSDPDNPIHAWQWDFTALVLDEVHAMDPRHPAYEPVRKKMDVALSSDHFFWASAKPWWSVEMIEVGAFRLLETLRSMPGVTPEKLEKARNFYEHIISTAFNWQRSGKIRSMMREQKTILRVPFKERTLGQGGGER
ncbi:MAG: hypothetical protein HY473_02460, partial [Candidatus Sungbacteria bacterium]|nr:hypothetical protein [Candidatus Sungbacteria bacterium]